MEGTPQNQSDGWWIVVGAGRSTAPLGAFRTEAEAKMFPGLWQSTVRDSATHAYRDVSEEFEHYFTTDEPPSSLQFYFVGRNCLAFHPQQMSAVPELEYMFKR